MGILDTGIKTIQNVAKVAFGLGSFSDLNALIEDKKLADGYAVVFLDTYFSNSILFDRLSEYEVVIVDTSVEPKTTTIDNIMSILRSKYDKAPNIIVGIGGGSTLDTAKACSNLFTNPGSASDYQGWDKVQNKGVFKVGVPTISGTGSEATRTCVMTNPKNGLKLGMNSDFTVFDHIILDPNLTETVPRDQYLYTGMDAYIHCMEALEGGYRNPVGDAYSRETLKLCREVFNSSDMLETSMREKLMVASYLGGCSIATSYVGVVHPFSAGLSVVLGTHHCEANCIVMNAMEEFYPKYYQEFHSMVKRQNVHLRKGIASNLTDEQYDELYNATIIHEKPLYNALGKKFKEILNKDRVIEIFKQM